MYVPMGKPHVTHGTATAKKKLAALAPWVSERVMLAPGLRAGRCALAQ